MNEINIKYFNNGCYVKFNNVIIIYYNSENKIHRDNDLPAMISFDGTQKWFKDDKMHRDNLPAIICNYGCYEYWKYGEFINRIYDMEYVNNNLINFQEEIEKIYSL